LRRGDAEEFSGRSVAAICLGKRVERGRSDYWKSRVLRIDAQATVAASLVDELRSGLERRPHLEGDPLTQADERARTVSFRRARVLRVRADTTR
jgi:hypothetical protein